MLLRSAYRSALPRVALRSLSSASPSSTFDSFVSPSSSSPSWSSLSDGVIRRIVGSSLVISGDLSGGVLDRCMRLYRSLPPTDRGRFMSILAKEFGVKRDEVISSASSLVRKASESPASESDAAFVRSLGDLERAVTPLYNSLFVSLAGQPGGMRFLFDVRSDLLSILHAKPPNADLAALRSLDASLQSHLQTWFGAGTLQLARVTWESSPAALLEKLIHYEAVHPMHGGFPDIKQRLIGPNRRCYAFFHSTVPDEPLVFIQVALTNAISDSVQAILSEEPPKQDKDVFIEDEQLERASKAAPPTTAIFYSITSTQDALSGVSLGAFLIKRVVKEILRDIPSVKTFSTLSPIPGFATWLKQRLAVEVAGGSGASVFEEGDLVGITKDEAVSRLTAALSSPLTSEWARPILLRNCAHYLTVERRRGRCADPVGNFHLRNGASVWRLNWGADTSARGVKQSAAIMVNYKYDLDVLKERSRKYAESSVIEAGEQVKALLKA